LGDTHCLARSHSLSFFSPGFICRPDIQLPFSPGLRALFLDRDFRRSFPALYRGSPLFVDVFKDDKELFRSSFPCPPFRIRIRRRFSPSPPTPSPIYIAVRMRLNPCWRSLGRPPPLGISQDQNQGAFPPLCLSPPLFSLPPLPPIIESNTQPPPEERTRDGSVLSPFSFLSCPSLCLNPPGGRHFLHEVG